MTAPRQTAREIAWDIVQNKLCHDLVCTSPNGCGCVDAIVAAGVLPCVAEDIRERAAKVAELPKPPQVGSFPEWERAYFEHGKAIATAIRSLPLPPSCAGWRGTESAPNLEYLTAEQVLDEIDVHGSPTVAKAARKRYAIDCVLPLHAMKVSLGLEPVTMYRRKPSPLPARARTGDKMSDVRKPEVVIAALKRLVDRLGMALQAVNDGCEDEGDRVYLGSSNDYDTVKSAFGVYQEYRILDRLPGVEECRHGNKANGSCEKCR